MPVSTTRWTVQHTLAVLLARTGTAYEDEGVDELEHALQTAQQARDADSDDELVLAALLHDIGRTPEVLALYGPGTHEQLGARFCCDNLGVRCAYLVENHVPAKRYLVTVDPDYTSLLSPASIRSLAR